MEEGNLLDDGIIVRENATMIDLPEINKSLLEVISSPVYWNAVEDFYEACYEENQYRDDLIKEKRKTQMQIVDFMDNLNPDNSLYQLNSKALISLNNHTEFSQGRIENVFDFSEDFYGYDEDEYREEYSGILSDIQLNYKKAISRHSDYCADLERHIASWNWLVYSPFLNDESVLVWQLQWDIFLVSHFAPSSIKMWYYLIKQALTSKMPIVFAVPEFLAKQLRKAWFIDLWYKVPQNFNWEVVMKNVLVNGAVTDSDLKELVDRFSNNYLWKAW